MLDRDNDRLLADKFEYSHYLFAGQCMVIIERSYMLTPLGDAVTSWAQLHHSGALSA